MEYPEQTCASLDVANSARTVFVAFCNCAQKTLSISNLWKVAVLGAFDQCCHEMALAFHVIK